MPSRKKPSVRPRKPGSIIASLAEYARGVAGGLIVSLPLLYTMEVWWSGFIARPWRLLLYILGTFALLLIYNRIAGIRRDASFAEVAIDSIEEIGLGVVISAFVLWALGRIDGTVPLSEAVGKIVVEAGIVAIGVSVGTAQLGAAEDGDVGMKGDSPERRDGSGTDRPVFSRQMAFALCGAILFAANIAPTEEVVMIAAEIDPIRLLVLVAFSTSVAAGVLFYSDFRGSSIHAAVEGALDVVRGTVMTYAIALIASALLLSFYGRFDGASLHTAIALTVVLAVPGALGASAGRLLLQ